MRGLRILKRVEIDVRDWEKQSAKTAEAELRSRAAQIASQLAASHAGENFCVAEVQDGDGKLLQAVADTLKSKFNGPIFLVGADEWISCPGRIGTKTDDVDISGEQIDSADRANCRRQRRRPTRECSGRRQGFEQDRGSAGKSARAFKLNRSHGALTDGKRAFLIRRFRFFPSADIR